MKKSLTGFTLLLAGALLGATAGAHFAPTVLHAQDQPEQMNGLSSCITAVPKDWGIFRGASSYGLAFEDQKGTLRFVQRPVCSTTSSSGNLPTSTVDLQVVRR